MWKYNTLSKNSSNPLEANNHREAECNMKLILIAARNCFLNSFFCQEYAHVIVALV